MQSIQRKSEFILRLKTSISFSFYLFLIAIILAYFEVQIEGQNGWASALPTWKTTDPRLTWIFGGRPVTGYHLALNLLLLSFFHWPILFNKWTFINEAKVISNFALLAVIWDFLWFVINPYFGLQNYNSENIWWFSNWFLGFPIDYYFGISMSIIIRCIPSFLRKEQFRNALFEGVYFVVGCLLLTAIFVFIFQIL